MKIKLLGYDGPLSQIKTFEKEFINQGHEIVQDNPDILFNHTGYFHDVLEESLKYPKAKKVGILLDCDFGNSHWPEQMVREQLLQLDVKLTISETSRQHIFTRTGVECDVVYYPMRPISKINIYKGVDFVCVGRVYSQNKRYRLVYEFLRLFNYPTENLIVAGPEKPPFGYHIGLVEDNVLNELYNSSHYLLFFSSLEGIGLPMIEAVCAGCIPILCNDNACVHEFGLSDFAADPHPQSLVLKLKEIQENKQKFLDKLKELAPIFQEKFSVKSVVSSIIKKIEECK